VTDSADPTTSAGAPRLFRILVPATDLARSTRFFETLLGIPGRQVAPGRVYFDCGPVILGVLDYSGRAPEETPRPVESIYLATDRIEEVHARAVRLGCTSKELLHGDPRSPMGEIVVRPWGERSFYIEDPTGNSICFVDAATVFTGTPEQIASLRASSES